LLFEIPEDGQLVVSDLAGRIFYQQKITTGSQILNTSDWVSGMYFIRFIGAERQMIGKVVKR